MALALLMREWCAEYGVRLTTLTVDHQLRAESAHEANQVAQWMQANGITHEILTPDANASINNTQARARDMRYRAMTQWCRAHDAAHLLVAQHYDDQAETVALQQHRGASAPSRAGMALCRMHEGVRLVRPLLGVRKATLVDYLDTQRHPYLRDPSNDHDGYARNRLRHNMTDADAQSLWHVAQHAGEVRHDDEKEMNHWFACHVQMQDAATVFPLSRWRSAREELRMDLLSRAIHRIGGKPFRPRLHETIRLDARLCNEPQGIATLGHCRVRWKENVLLISAEHPLEPTASAAYMAPSNDPNALVSEPFWWFNYAPYNDGAT